MKIIPFFTTENDPNQLEFMQSVIAEYQSQQPGVEVDLVIAWPAERGRRLLTALASGADLGIFEVEPTLMPQWVEAGYLLPLDDIVSNIGAGDFVDGSLYAQDGQVYAVPYAESVYGLWVRKDLLEQAGLPVPTNYEELLTAARLLTEGDMYGISLPAGQNIATVNYFSIFLWQNGGDYFTCDGEVALGEPQALQAIQRWTDAQNPLGDGNIIPGGGAGQPGNTLGPLGGALASSFVRADPPGDRGVGWRLVCREPES